jgi:hypothetical protein
VEAGDVLQNEGGLMTKAVKIVECYNEQYL